MGTSHLGRVGTETKREGEGRGVGTSHLGRVGMEMK